jgi:hypothetical protein
MLRSFRVENHKSIKDEQELSLLPAYDKSRPVVPVAAVFGANASGKSNLLDALRWLRDAVLTSFAAWQPGAGVPRMPFRLDPASAAEPSGYGVDIEVNGVRYAYGVIVDDERVREEWLYAYPRKRRRVIFERNDDVVLLGSTVSDFRMLGDALRRQTRDNALFLTVAALNDLDEVHDVYQWFRGSLAFGPLANASAVRDATRRLQAAQGAALVSLLRVADLGLTDVTVAEQPDIGGDFPSRSTLLFHHGGGGVPLGVEEQSDGTKSWLALVVNALAVLEGGGVLVVDEVDASLHPHLSAQLINLFRNGETNDRGAQLVFTTHDATLLDDETLARDEIWFVEKDVTTGATRLYPLTDFHPRKNENTEGRYLAGGYGAVPVLSDLDFRNAVRVAGDADAA